ncbi:MAG TPA: cadherin-like domain-containing protein, partial [Candidatus Limnocylindrales bacterium]
PAHGSLSGSAPNLTYTPALNYNGPDSFTFKANDGTVDSNTATVSITVRPHIAFVQMSTPVTLTAANRVTLSRPGGVVAGDLLLAVFEASAGNTTITPPTGWTQVVVTRTGSSKTGLTQIVFRRFVASAEPTSYVFSLSGKQNVVAGIVAYRGVDASNPIDASAGQSGSGSSPSAPSVTTSSTSDMLIAVFGSAVGVTFNPPSGMSERIDAEIGALKKPGVSLETADALQPATGPTGSRVANALASGSWLGQLIALKPAV